MNTGCQAPLTGGKAGPDFLEMVMAMPDGRKLEYQVPVVHVQAYTKDEIFQKKLIFFVTVLYHAI